VADYLPTGDFAFFTGTVSSPMSATGAALGLPSATRSVEIEVTADSTVWTGVSLVPDAGVVNVLALPANAACQVTSGSGGSPETVMAALTNLDTGEALGVVDPEHALLVQAGIPSALVIDLGLGAVSGKVELTEVRNDATVTPGPSAGQVLVAGGSNPKLDALDTADLLTLDTTGGSTGASSRSLVMLQAFRTKHAAVTLPSTGETLLIGGIGLAPAGGEIALSSIETVSPATLAGSPPPQLASLMTPRVHPTALWLPSGQVFVGGGFDLSGAPLNSVEWFNGAVTQEIASNTICTPNFGKNLAAPWSFAPLEGGAVLAVLAAEPPAGCASNVFVLRSDSIVSVSPVAGVMEPPILLFPGAESMPLLMVDNSVSRYDPWENEFEAMPSTALPESLPINTFVSADPGLALWQSADDHLNAFRFDTRNTYSTDSPGAPPGLTTEPTEWAPDRAAGSDVVFNMSFGLTLSNSATAFLTDATFADVSMSFTISSSELTPLLRDNTTGVLFPIDLASCINKESEFFNAPVEVQRVGATVSARLVTAQGAAQNPCSVPGLGATERVALGFRGPPSATATVNTVTVTRLGSSS
jgi:hypothetical protein